MGRWFGEATRAYGRPTCIDAPRAWTVAHAGEILGRPRAISHSGNVKRVFRAKIGDHGVVLKASSANHTQDRSGGNLFLELAYLESLRGLPGVPELFGAWVDGCHVWYAVADTGDPIGVGNSGRGARASSPSWRYDALARSAPLALAAALLRCFKSFSDAGWLLDDFKPQQFTLDARGRVYHVDGPSLLAASPLGRAVVGLSPAAKNVLPAPPTSCAFDSACPRSKAHHACARPGDCEAGAAGAREARGWCRRGACVALSSRTHVFDAGARPWLLPRIARLASDAKARALLEAAVANATREDPDDRPTFDDLLALFRA